MSLRTSDRCHWCGNPPVLPGTNGEAQRLPLLTKGSCPSAHTGAEGIRTPIFLCALVDAVLQSLSQKSKIFASSLYTREPLGAPAPVRLSMFLRKTGKLYHILRLFTMRSSMGILRKNDTGRYPIVYRIQTGWAPIGCRPCRLNWQLEPLRTGRLYRRF